MWVDITLAVLRDRFDGVVRHKPLTELYDVDPLAGVLWWGRLCEVDWRTETCSLLLDWSLFATTRGDSTPPSNQLSVVAGEAPRTRGGKTSVEVFPSQLRSCFLSLEIVVSKWRLGMERWVKCRLWTSNVLLSFPMWLVYTHFFCGCHAHDLCRWFLI